jgi:hypothetical protein
VFGSNHPGDTVEQRLVLTVLRIRACVDDLVRYKRVIGRVGIVDGDRDVVVGRQR